MNEESNLEPLKLRLNNLLEELEISLEVVEGDLAEMSATIDDLKSELIQKQIQRNILNSRLKATDALLAALR